MRPFWIRSIGGGSSQGRSAGTRKLSQSIATFQNMMVPTRIAPSVTDLYSPDMAFCAASAMMTRIRMSAMPMAHAPPHHDTEQEEQEQVHRRAADDELQRRDADSEYLAPVEAHERWLPRTSPS